MYLGCKKLFSLTACACVCAVQTHEHIYTQSTRTRTNARMDSTNVRASSVDATRPVIAQVCSTAVHVLHVMHVT